jgi:hypothetical protein
LITCPVLAEGKKCVDNKVATCLAAQMVDKMVQGLTLTDAQKASQTRLQLLALAYNLSNFLRRLTLPKSIRQWSLTTLREKLATIRAKVTAP